MAASVISGGVITDSRAIGTSHTTGSISPLSGSNRVALIFSAYESNSDRGVSSVAWNGQTATLVDSVELNSGGIRKIFVHRILEADYPSSAGTVVTTYDGDVGNDGLIAVVQLQDAAQTSTFGTVAKATESAGTSLQINPTSGDDALTLCIGIGDNTDPLTTSGGTEIANFGASNDLLMGITADATSSSSTVTVTFGVDSNDQILAIGFAVAPASSGTNVDVGIAAESDAALPIEITRLVDVGQAIEAEAALSIEPSRAIDIGQASNAETALSVTPERLVDVGQAAESEVALPITITRAIEIGIAVETDSALEIIEGGGVLVGTAEESDQALDVTITREVPVGQAVEGEQALSITPTREIPVGIATEAESALDIVGVPVTTVDQAIETDTALPITITRFVPVGQAIENDTALPMVIGVPAASIFLKGNAGETVSLKGSAT